MCIIHVVFKLKLVMITISCILQKINKRNKFNLKKYVDESTSYFRERKE